MDRATGFGDTVLIVLTDSPRIWSMAVSNLSVSEHESAKIMSGYGQSVQFEREKVLPAVSNFFSRFPVDLAHVEVALSFSIFLTDYTA